MVSIFQIDCAEEMGATDHLDGSGMCSVMCGCECMCGQARIYARAPGARAQGGKFSGAAY